MRKYLLPQEGKFYKANLHMHTTVSDGQMTPEEVKEAYVKRGYSIVAYTDHEVLVPHNELADETFLPITSYEAATNQYIYKDFEFEKTYHLNLYSLDKDKSVSPVFAMERLWPPHSISYMSEEAKQVHFHRDYAVDSINALIKKANEEGFLVCYNHPVWSTQSYADYAKLKGLWGVEWYNTGCARGGYPDTVQPIDDLIRLGQPVFPVASDDAHADKESLHDCFGGFSMIKAPALEYDAVMQALVKGDFYSSTGPTIEEMYLEDGKLYLTTSAVSKVEVMTDRRFRRVATGDKITQHVFDLSGFLVKSEQAQDWISYFRVTITDEQGNQAQTRAYFPKDWQ